jgi:hypothetical protein
MNREQKIQIFRSRFAGRVDVYGRQWISKKEDGTQVRGFAPVCQNFFESGCHIKLKDGVPCHKCEIQKYAPVTDDSVYEHISGAQPQIHYLLIAGGNIRFAALDFDLKPGKEHLGYTFEDVGKCSDMLTSWAIPHGIARSTGQGFHIYMFGEEPMPANEVRAALFYLFERVGFMEQMRQGIRGLPEIFPKQSMSGLNGVGNGIKPPMIESAWANERNGFVNDDNVFLSPDMQWTYLDNIGRISNAQLKALIEKEKIPVHELPFDQMATEGRGGQSGTLLDRQRGGWQPPLVGSFEMLLEGCAAMRKIRDKCDKKVDPTHDEGMALWHFAMSTADGVQYFKDGKIPGWGQTDKDWQQLEYSLAKNYSPHTCLKLQEMGVCVKGTKCFEKKPPLDQVEGQMVVVANVPKERWPEPSPIRYAYGRGEDFMKKIMSELDELKAEANEDTKMRVLKDLVKRVQVFDEEQQKLFKDHLKKAKLVKAGELAKYWNEASEKHEAEFVEAVSQQTNSVTIHGKQYLRVDPYGYKCVRRLPGNKKKEIILASTDITIDEVRAYQDDDRVVSTVYRGKARAQGTERTFEIDTAKWHDSSEFFVYFGGLLNEDFNILREDVGQLRQAAFAFSRQSGIQRTAYLVTQGWYGDKYLMPSVIVDKDGVRPNTEQCVDLTGKSHTQSLDFTILGDTDFKETLLHLKMDFLNAWPRQWTFFGLAHTLMPVVLRGLGAKQKPALFYEGLTGSGKTQLTHLMQYFWGDFDTILNLNSSGKGVMHAGYEFKDTMLVVDDYKGATNEQMRALEAAIQYSYDPTASIKLKRDSTSQQDKPTRALFVFSGEQFLTADAAKVARTIIIEVDKQDTRKTRANYERCWKLCHNYRGVTPRFLHWFLNQDMQKMKAFLYSTKDDLYDRIAGKQNADRLSYNLALSYTVWSLWCEFLLHSEVCDFKEREELVNEHWGYVLQVLDDMTLRCEDEQDGLVFVRLLKQLLSAHEVSIAGLPGFDPKNKPEIGWAPDQKKFPNTVYLLPDITFNLVMQFGKSANIHGTERSISRQLVDLGIIRGTDKGRCNRQVRRGENRVRVWDVDLNELGITRPTLHPVDNRFPAAVQGELPQNSDGIL